MALDSEPPGQYNPATRKGLKTVPWRKGMPGRCLTVLPVRW